MKTLAFWLLALLLAAPDLKAQPYADSRGIGNTRTFQLGKSSKLSVEGKTNVNGFTCGCAEQFGAQTFGIGEREADGLSLPFHQTKLKMRVKSLDCGNALMNKDLQQAMNADQHPYISIELLKVTEDRCSKMGKRPDWVKVKAQARITINGKSNDYWLDVTAKKNADDRYRFIGSKALRMTDFGIKPPVALMGMVKVQDEITILFDLDVAL